MQTRTFEELKIGDSASLSKTVTECDVYAFAGVTMDFNPAHLNEEEAKKGMFGHRIAHGMLSVGFISAVLGTRLPGPGAIYLGQEVKFLKPVFFGDTITATVTITELKPEKNIIILSTVCTNQNGDTVIDGVAATMLPKK